MEREGRWWYSKQKAVNCWSTMCVILAEQVKQVWGEEVRVSDGASVTQVLNELQEGSYTAPWSRQTFPTPLWSGGRGFGVPLWGGWRGGEEGGGEEEKGGREGGRKGRGGRNKKKIQTTVYHKHPSCINTSLSSG